MTLSNPARYILIVVLLGLSLVPQLLTVGVLGEANLWILIGVWIALLLCFAKGPKRLIWLASIIGALIMAIPPVPNFLSPSEGLQVSFIGWRHILEGNGLYGIVFFFVGYLLLFWGVTRALRAGMPARA
jgi:hypothetical protein